MYIDNICLNIVPTDNSAYTSQNQPVANPDESGSFLAVLSETINEAVCPPEAQPPAPPAYSYTYAESVAANAADFENADTSAVAGANTSLNETAQATANENVSAPPPMDSVPPVIMSAPVESETSYISKYYPIEETEVVGKIVEVRQIINSQDLSGKTDIEKYDYIENRFIDTFGKDFMMARDLYLPSSMFYMIGVEFSDALGRHIQNPEQVNRQRLHGDATAAEIQDKIRSNYSADMTNRDLILMVNQMRNEGVLDIDSVRSLGEAGARKLMDTLATVKKYMRYSTKSSEQGGTAAMSLAERDRNWVAILDKPVNLHQLLATYNVWKQYGKVDIGQDSAPFLVKHMGGVLGSDGMFIIDAPSDGDTAWWERYMNLLLSELDEYNDLIRSRMAMIDGAEASVMGAYQGTGENPGIGENPGVGENAQSGINGEAGESQGVEEAPGAEDSQNAENTGEGTGGEGSGSESSGNEGSGSESSGNEGSGSESSGGEGSGGEGYSGDSSGGEQAGVAA